MWQPYRDAVRSILPEAKIVIDKFHVVRYASDALEAARKEIRKSLTENKRDAGRIGHMILDMIREDWFAEDSQIWDHGIDMYTLIQKMEDGSFFSDPH